MYNILIQNIMRTYQLNAEKGFFTMNGELYSGVTLVFKTVIRPKDKKPKYYKRVGGFVCRERGRYESGCVEIYRRKDGQYVASLYKDGCFNPYYCKCELNQYVKPN